MNKKYPATGAESGPGLPELLSWVALSSDDSEVSKKALMMLMRLNEIKTPGAVPGTDTLYDKIDPRYGQALTNYPLPAWRFKR